MIKSMTGYGRREAVQTGGTVVVEIRSVNHRHCEIVIRSPKTLSAKEDELRKLIQARCQRGRIELTVSFSGRGEEQKTLSLDRRLARQYYQAFRQLQRELRLEGSIDLALFAGFRELLTLSSEQSSDDPRLGQTVIRLLGGALGDLDRMRRREGQALARDTRKRMRMVRQTVQAIEARAPRSVQVHFDRMKARIETLAGSQQVDQGRLAQELALYADRCDVTEELTRLHSHLEQFDGALNSRAPVGRTLDFLLQEIGREVNTVGSKANDADIAASIVMLKSELEKVREQVQNIE
jgi:uncharacterized protein (TIGR00255 family)